MNGKAVLGPHGAASWRLINTAGFSTPTLTSPPLPELSLTAHPNDPRVQIALKSLDIASERRGDGQRISRLLFSSTISAINRQYSITNTDDTIRNIQILLKQSLKTLQIVFSHINFDWLQEICCQETFTLSNSTIIGSYEWLNSTLPSLLLPNLPPLVSSTTIPILIQTLTSWLSIESFQSLSPYTSHSTSHDDDHGDHEAEKNLSMTEQYSRWIITRCATLISLLDSIIFTIQQNEMSSERLQLLSSDEFCFIGKSLNDEFLLHRQNTPLTFVICMSLNSLNHENSWMNHVTVTKKSSSSSQQAPHSSSSNQRSSEVSSDHPSSSSSTSTFPHPSLDQHLSSTVATEHPSFQQPPSSTSHLNPPQEDVVKKYLNSCFSQFCDLLHTNGVKLILTSDSTISSDFLSICTLHEIQVIMDIKPNILTCLALSSSIEIISTPETFLSYRKSVPIKDYIGTSGAIQRILVNQRPVGYRLIALIRPLPSSKNPPSIPQLIVFSSPIISSSSIRLTLLKTLRWIRFQAQSSIRPLCIHEKDSKISNVWFTSGGGYPEACLAVTFHGLSRRFSGDTTDSSSEGRLAPVINKIWRRFEEELSSQSSSSSHGMYLSSLFSALAEGYESILYALLTSHLNDISNSSPLQTISSSSTSSLGGMKRPFELIHEWKLTVVQQFCGLVVPSAAWEFALASRFGDPSTYSILSSEHQLRDQLFTLLAALETVIGTEVIHPIGHC